jgi:hypothetical protein
MFGLCSQTFAMSGPIHKEASLFRYLYLGFFFHVFQLLHSFPRRINEPNEFRFNFHFISLGVFYPSLF